MSIVRVQHDTEQLIFQTQCHNPDCAIPSLQTASYQDLIILAHCREHDRPAQAYRPSAYVN